MYNSIDIIIIGAGEEKEKEQERYSRWVSVLLNEGQWYWFESLSTVVYSTNYCPYAGAGWTVCTVVGKRTIAQRVRRLSLMHHLHKFL